MKAIAPYTYSEQIKNGKIQIVFSFRDENGKRKLKWMSTGLSEGCSKKHSRKRPRRSFRSLLKISWKSFFNNNAKYHSITQIVI